MSLTVNWLSYSHCCSLCLAHIDVCLTLNLIASVKRKWWPVELQTWQAVLLSVNCIIDGNNQCDDLITKNHECWCIELTWEVPVPPAMDLVRTRLRFSSPSGLCFCNLNQVALQKFMIEYGVSGLYSRASQIIGTVDEILSMTARLTKASSSNRPTASSSFKAASLFSAVHLLFARLNAETQIRSQLKAGRQQRHVTVEGSHSLNYTIEINTHWK